MTPTAIINNLAVYKIGTGDPLFLMPYPHAATFISIADDPLTRVLLKTGRSVITFDPPGAWHSAREAVVNMQEMLDCARETLDHFAVTEPVDLVSHSMGSFCALAFALKYQNRIKRLVLAGCTTGWRSLMKHGVHKTWKWWKDREFWQSRFWGTRVYLGLNNLKNYNRLNNIVSEASFVDKSHVRLFPFERDDHKKPVPVRGRWLEKVWRYDYRKEVHALTMPVLICTGIKDPQTPPVMSRELQDRIMNSRLVLFENSGHFPFVEEEARFLEVVGGFLQNGQSYGDLVPADCPCPKNCQWHGHCRECFDNHGAKGKIPYCRRGRAKRTSC
jgi:proline iminopeptidase